MSAVYDHLGRNAIHGLQRFFEDQSSRNNTRTYRQWVDTMDEPTSLFVEANAVSLAAFSDYEEPYMHLQAELKQYPRKREHPAWIGTGFVSAAYRLGDDSVVRLKRRNARAGLRAEEIGIYAGSLLPGSGIEDVEQLQAHSYHRGVTVSQYEQGKRMGQLRAEDVPKITELTIARGLTAIDELNAQELRLDPKFGNILLRPDGVLKFLDYNALWDTRHIPESDAAYLGKLLAYGGVYPCKLETEADFARLAAAETSRLPLIVMYKRVVAERYDDERLVQGAQQLVDDSARRIAQCTNATWVMRRRLDIRYHNKPLVINPVPREMLDTF
ncbi:MAG TPA: hypothetical protein VLE73_05310 [Candidatus Saccharimonadales bacterium]|nr:hypothetical protein [Candidatus Saccharimonadales bacterium]